MLNMQRTPSTAMLMEPIFFTQNGRGITRISWTHLQKSKLQFGCPEVEVLGVLVLVRGEVEGHVLQIQRKMKAGLKNVSITSPFGRYVSSVKKTKRRGSQL